MIEKGEILLITSRDESGRELIKKGLGIADKRMNKEEIAKGEKLLNNGASNDLDQNAVSS